MQGANTVISKKDVEQKLREEKIQKIQDVISNTRQRDKFSVKSKKLKA